MAEGESWFIGRLGMWIFFFFSFSFSRVKLISRTELLCLIASILFYFFMLVLEDFTACLKCQFAKGRIMCLHEGFNVLENP